MRRSTGRFVSTVSTDCRAVFACLGTFLAQRGFGRRALGRACWRTWRRRLDIGIDFSLAVYVHSPYTGLRRTGGVIVAVKAKRIELRAEQATLDRIQRAANVVHEQ